MPISCPSTRRRPRSLLLALALLAAPGHAATLAEAVATLENGDYARAATLLEPLARDGNSVAQFRLGSLHSLGQGVPADQRLAAAWFEKASAGGHHEATVTLANMYLSGLGVPRDEHRALALFEQAAEIAALQEIDEDSCE